MPKFRISGEVSLAVTAVISARTDELAEDELRSKLWYCDFFGVDMKVRNVDLDDTSIIAPDNSENTDWWELGLDHAAEEHEKGIPISKHDGPDADRHWNDYVDYRNAITAYRADHKLPDDDDDLPEHLYLTERNNK